MVINFSTGAVGISVEKRLEYLEAIRPDIAALNMGSMNYAKYSKRRKEFIFGFIFENSFDTIIQFLTAMNEYGIRPEHECFELGHLASLEPLIDMGILESPLQISLVTGRARRHTRPRGKPQAHGVAGPATGRTRGRRREQLGHGRRLARAVGPRPGRDRRGRQRARRSRGQLLSAGREGCKGNGDLCEEAARQIEAGGRKVATIAEARELLGVPRNV